jgi:hypothetical protein
MHTSLDFGESLGLLPNYKLGSHCTVFLIGLLLLTVGVGVSYSLPFPLSCLALSLLATTALISQANCLSNSSCNTTASAS